MHPKIMAKKACFDAPLSHITSAIRHGAFLTDAAFTRVFLAIYTASFAWMFLIPADFWDDFAVKNNPDLVKMGYQSGLVPFGWFTKAVLALPYRDVVGHGYVFLLYIAVTLLVRRFVAEFVPASEREKNAIALLTAVLPLYLSRFQIAASFYCLCLLCFCVGALTLARAITRSSPALYRLAAYVCLVLAFFVQSFLVIYGFVILVITLSIARHERGQTIMARFATAALTITRRAPDAIILPFAFFFLKTCLVPTTGPFLTYNAVTLKGLAEAIPVLPFTTVNSFGNATGISAGWLTFSGTLIAATAGMLAIRPAPGRSPAEARPTRSDAITLLVVFCGLMFAIFPYAVVNRLPTPFDFEDRNQMTMLLVAGAAITYGVKCLVREQLRWTVIFLVLVWSTASNAWAFIAVISDGHMQNAVVRAISQSDLIRRDKSLLVDWSQWPHLARHRSLSTAQLNCLMKQAFGDESHFAAAMSKRPFDWDRELRGLRLFFETGTCFRDYSGGEVQLLTITPGEKVLMLRSAAKLSVLWMTDADRYQNALNGFAAVTVGPVPKGWLKQE